MDRVLSAILELLCDLCERKRLVSLVEAHTPCALVLQPLAAVCPYDGLSQLRAEDLDQLVARVSVQLLAVSVNVSVEPLD